MNYQGRNCRLVSTWMDGGVMYARIQFVDDGRQIVVRASEVGLG